MVKKVIAGFVFSICFGLWLSGCADLDQDRVKESEGSIEVEPYEKIVVGMNFSEVKKIAGKPTSTMNDGQYEVWVYYRFPRGEIENEKSGENIKGGPYSVTFLNGKVEKVEVLKTHYNP